MTVSTVSSATNVAYGSLISCIDFGDWSDLVGTHRSSVGYMRENTITSDQRSTPARESVSCRLGGTAPLVASPKILPVLPGSAQVQAAVATNLLVGHNFTVQL
jgi:hypothetical protein